MESCYCGLDCGKPTIARGGYRYHSNFIIPNKNTSESLKHYDRVFKSVVAELGDEKAKLVALQIVKDKNQLKKTIKVIPTRSDERTLDKFFRFESALPLPVVAEINR